ncbi:hypothetical protein [Aureibacter tunicatorum]|uniref:Uncharacterized protein n=1 Tax=Aureibacter tunicatorum TaxID=866807 RepID=A0AAE3XSR7_9BACT|nr:hypothetical protein [Aureibacter tunicatorum]MDR6241805.1 hypothetical protein [Aureibacter tunicatorum]BDD07052.1 hypothetical protein AUTU_45350 [Aureibacter tunicatorum]
MGKGKRNFSFTTFIAGGIAGAIAYMLCKRNKNNYSHQSISDYNLGLEEYPEVKTGQFKKRQKPRFILYYFGRFFIRVR